MTKMHFVAVKIIQTELISRRRKNWKELRMKAFYNCIFYIAGDDKKWRTHADVKGFIVCVTVCHFPFTGLDTFNIAKFLCISPYECNHPGTLLRLIIAAAAQAIYSLGGEGQEIIETILLLVYSWVLYCPVIYFPLSLPNPTTRSLQ